MKFAATFFHFWIHLTMLELTRTALVSIEMRIAVHRFSYFCFWFRFTFVCKVHKNIPTSWFIFILWLDYFSLSSFVVVVAVVIAILFEQKVKEEKNVILFRCDVYGLLTFCTWAIVIRSTCNIYRPVERLYYFYGKGRNNFEESTGSRYQHRNHIV